MYVKLIHTCKICEHLITEYISYAVRHHILHHSITDIEHTHRIVTYALHHIPYHRQQIFYSLKEYVCTSQTDPDFKINTLSQAPKILKFSMLTHVLGWSGGRGSWERRRRFLEHNFRNFRFSKNVKISIFSQFSGALGQNFHHFLMF